MSCRPSWCPAVDAVQDDPEAQALLTATRRRGSGWPSCAAESRRVEEYLAGSGFRLAAGFDLTNPTIGERPDILLDRIRNCLDHDRDAAMRRSEQVADEMRADVPEEHRAEFDDLLTESRLVYRLRDERGLYSDAAAVGLLRLALIELGRRLFERGRINFMYDTLDLTADEIDADPRRRRRADRRRAVGAGRAPQGSRAPRAPHRCSARRRPSRRRSTSFRRRWRG